jgi:hypothetical protein
LECILSHELKRIHAFLPVSRDAWILEWSLDRIFGGGLWLASNFHEEGFDFIG